MHNICVYYAPGTCSRTVLIALEEANVRYDAKLLVYMRGEHKSPDYLALNPHGKTPLLVVDNQPIHETAAILLYLAQAFPKAKLLPLGRGQIQDAQTVAELIWCASELHPTVFRIRIPQYFCDHVQGRIRQKEMAIESMHAKFSQIEERLKLHQWFLGEHWSVIDGYLFWVWFRLIGTGFDVTDYPMFADHFERIQQRPSVIRAMQFEQQAGQKLKQQGLMVNFDTFRPGQNPQDFIAQLPEQN